MFKKLQAYDTEGSLLIFSQMFLKQTKLPEQEEDDLVQGCLRTDVALLQVSLLHFRQQDSHRF